MIRELTFEDYDFASLLLWKSFYFAEKNVASVEGMEFFRDATQPVSLSMSAFEGETRYFGSFLNNELVGVGALKGKGHILLIYIQPEFHHRGLGSELLTYLESLASDGEVFVNASDFAVGFYKKMGYLVAGEREKEKGLITTPMKKIL